MADAASTGADVRNSNGFAITPGAGEFASNTRRVYVGISGHIVAVTPTGDEVVLQNVPVGFHDLLAKQILAETTTGSPTVSTTAGALVGFY